MNRAPCSSVWRASSPRPARAAYSVPVAGDRRCEGESLVCTEGKYSREGVVTAAARQIGNGRSIQFNAVNLAIKVPPGGTPKGSSEAIPLGS